MKRPMRLYIVWAYLILAGISCAFGTNASHASDYIWIEGESPQSSTMTRHPLWYDQVKTERFSGNGFISNWSDVSPGEATYTFDVPTTSAYALWVRANPTQAKLSYKMDSGDYQEIDMTDPIGTTIVSADGKVDLRFLAWIKVTGTMNLGKGTHEITFRMHSDLKNHGMIDCFVFGTSSFVPNGARKPDENVAKANLTSNGCYIWIEGENTNSNTMAFDRQYDTVAGNQLSGGDCISNSDRKRAGEATYTLEAPETADYALWVRADLDETKLSYRFDGGEYKMVAPGPPIGRTMLTSPGQDSIRFVAWTKVGVMNLPKGVHTVTFKMHSDNQNRGMLDCFVLSQHDTFVPNGIEKPVEGSAFARDESHCGHIWIEGEATQSNTVTVHPWYSDVEKGLLSGGGLITHWDDQHPGEATYAFNVEDATDYTLWVRANPTESKLSYRVDGQEYRLIGFGSVIGRQNIGTGSPSDVSRSLAWAEAGKIGLSAGRHTITFKMHSDNHNHGMIDCFVLSRIPFVPNGIRKPSDSPPSSTTGDESTGYIWIEGEATQSQTVTQHIWYSNVAKDLLSGGDLLTHWDDKRPGEATYAFDVSTAGDHTLWVRANPAQSKLSYRIDAGAYQQIAMADPIGATMVSADKKPDLRTLAWIKAGTSSLAKGPHTIAFKMHSDLSNHGMIDCFVLSRGTFVPNGARKPNESRVTATTVGTGDYVWIEGEATQSNTVTSHAWYSDISKDLVSGGAVLSHWDDRRAGEATYNFEIPDTKKYTLWMRASCVETRLAYRLDGGTYQTVDMSDDRVVDETNVASDGRVDVRFLSWIRGDAFTIAKGPHSIGFKMEGPNSNRGMLDCFVLSSVPFTPHGTEKPGTETGWTSMGTWPFYDEIDPHTPDALLDLRDLNEKRAGESGYVKRNAAGEFVLGTGQPVRFWGANTYAIHGLAAKDLQAHAQHLGKRGVNMVRFQAALEPKGPGSKAADVDDAQIDECQKLLAAMKEEGIYTEISPYSADTDAVQPSWDIPDHPSGKPWGLLFWDPTLQAAYKSWIKELLTRPNPYDRNKVPLGKDPALAILQIQSRDSLLFSTMATVQGPEKSRLDALYAEWLKKEGKTTKPELSVRFSELGSPSPEVKDSIQFLAETMRAWNQEVTRYIHSDLGCQTLVTAGSWGTADEAKLSDCERWTYSVGDVMAANRYVAGEHANPTEAAKVGYQVSPGDFFTDPSLLLQPRAIPTNLKQPVGLPFVISESTWVSPLGYQSEGPFLVAAYGALAGLDACCWSAVAGVGYDSSIRKWQCANPAIMGGWPAAALLFRKGYAQKGDAVVHEERNLADMWDLRTPILSDDRASSQTMTPGNFSPLSSIQNGVNPLAFLVGPAEVVYEGDPKKSSVADLSKYIDSTGKIVKSITGEITMDTGIGLCSLNAPKAQGVTGFLNKAGNVKLGAVDISATNSYGTVLVVSLDNKDLTQSGKILVQITTRCRPHGWKSLPATFQSADKKSTYVGEKIESVGGTPWEVEESDLTLLIRNPLVKSVTPLDCNGYPMRDASVKTEVGNGTLGLTPPSKAMYLVLQ